MSVRKGGGGLSPSSSFGLCRCHTGSTKMAPTASVSNGVSLRSISYPRKSGTGYVLPGRGASLFGLSTPERCALCSGLSLSLIHISEPTRRTPI
eukprot:4673025-Pleurochrysis_carterae.AAC.3